MQPWGARCHPKMQNFFFATVLPSREALKQTLLACTKEKESTHALLFCLFLLKLGLDDHVVIMDCLISSQPTQLAFITQNGHQICNRILSRPALSMKFFDIKHADAPDPHCTLNLFQHMQKTGSICPDGRTLVALLNSCAKLKDLERGLEIHFFADKVGFLKKDLFVSSALVDMYCKCGVVNNAQQVFDQLPLRNIASWNSLVAGYVESGHGKLALLSYEHMQLEGFSPNPVTYVCILKVCGNFKDFQLGCKIHAEIEQKGYRPLNRFVGSALINMYIKCRLLPSAQCVFDSLLDRDVVAWTTLIGGYVEYGEAKEAVECFEQMQLQGICPNAFTFVCSLRACSIIGEIQKIQEIHSEIERKGLFEGSIYIGSVLVDAYVGCGFLAQAREVFERLPARDLILWTALIAGYVENGLAKEALECFDQMQLQGVVADARTFVCNLKACGCTKAISKGVEIHAEIKRRGLFPKDLFVGNALVDMYARWGSLNKAKEVFDKLLIKDPVSWNSLMAAYCDHGQADVVLQYYRQMLLEGTIPDDISVILTLKACSAVQDLGTGLQLHGEIERTGYMKQNPNIGGTLVDMYSKCGALDKAQKVFEELPLSDIDSWNALIAGYVTQGHDDEAVSCFHLIQSEGMYPDEVTFISILKACGQSGNISKGIEIHSEVERRNVLEQDPVVVGALINMYVKCGSLVKAQEVFDELLIHDLVLWNALIAGYADQGLGEEALKYFKRMQLEGVPPDDITLLVSLRSCGYLSVIAKGSVSFAEFKRVGNPERNPIIGQIVIDIFVENGEFDKAQQMFDNLPVRNNASWNALMTGYTKRGEAEQSLKCFDEMQLEGIFPDADSLLLTLEACGCLRIIERGYKIHVEIEKRGLQEGLLVGTALVDMYAKCGYLTTAKAVFDKISDRDVVLWNVMMAGYAEHNYSIYVLDLMTCMQVQKLSPSAPTFVLNLKACGNMGAITKVRELHDLIEKQGLVERDLVVGNSLVDVYAKCGLISTAQKVFDKLPVRDTASWNSLIFGYKQHGNSEDVFYMFDLLTAEGLKPDPLTFVILLNACSRTCLVESSEKYFDAMITCHGISPMFEHHSCIIDVLARAGQLGKAISLSSTPVCQNLVAWRTVLSACKNWGNLQDGRLAFQHAVSLDEGDAATYVLMSDLHAEAVMDACL